MSNKKYGGWVCLDWYDGPLCEVALVTFENGSKFAEIKSVGGWLGEEYSVGASGEKFHYNHMRLSREELQAMLDLLDGKPVKDFHEESVVHTLPCDGTYADFQGTTRICASYEGCAAPGCPYKSPKER